MFIVKVLLATLDLPAAYDFVEVIFNHISSNISDITCVTSSDISVNNTVISVDLQKNRTLSNYLILIRKLLTKQSHKDGSKLWASKPEQH